MQAKPPAVVDLLLPHISLLPQHTWRGDLEVLYNDLVRDTSLVTTGSIPHIFHSCLNTLGEVTRILSFTLVALFLICCYKLGLGSYFDRFPDDITSYTAIK